MKLILNIGIILFCLCSCTSTINKVSFIGEDINRYVIRTSNIVSDSMMIIQENTFEFKDNRLIQNTFQTYYPDTIYSFDTYLIDKKNEYRFETFKGDTLVSYIYSHQVKDSLITEAFHWTKDAEPEPRKVVCTYKKINDKDYLKEMVEYVSGGEEMYRLSFNYSEFANGRLTISQSLHGRVKYQEHFNIKLYDREINIPDVVLYQMYPIRQYQNFLYDGRMGTFNYYITGYTSDYEQSEYHANYEFNNAKLPIKADISITDMRFGADFSRTYFFYYQ